VLLGGHRRDQVRNISTDVLRQVIKVAALSAGRRLPDRATRDRAANRLLKTDESCAKPFRERHDLSSVIEITVRAAV
jgi:hypothetical protein